MKENDLQQKMQRRGFLGTLAAGAAAIGLTTLASPFRLNAQQAKPATSKAPVQAASPADQWFNKLKGKHRVVFDCTRPHDVLPFAWPKVFLITNSATGVPETDCGVVVVLRHDAIPYAFESRLWDTYKFGETFKAEDPKTKSPSLRNPFWKPMKGDFVIPGIGEVEIGINELQSHGVMFCVCDAAITVYSAALAAGMGKEADVIKKDWMAGLLPGIQLVPSGVWALGRAQEHGCQYIFAG
jgi:intracellular sulfur oxidation DsrE/DsrF family protein